MKILHWPNAALASLQILKSVCDRSCGFELWSIRQGIHRDNARCFQSVSGCQIGPLAIVVTVLLVTSHHILFDFYQGLMPISCDC